MIDRWVKHWCRSCAAYGEGPCVNAGHVSERLTLTNGKWKSYTPAVFAVAVPPPGGRGSVSHVECDAAGTPIGTVAP